MKLLVSLLALLFLAGCATSTVETRKEERRGAYDALPVEWRQLVDQGQIKVGMPQEAVYIAWGPPHQVVESESSAGRVTIWLYHGQRMEEAHYWGYRHVPTRRGYFLERYPERFYYSRDYLQAEIQLIDGVVSSWRTLPQPLR